MSKRFLRPCLAVVAMASTLTSAAAAQPRPAVPPATPPAAAPAPAAAPPPEVKVEAKPDPIAAALAPRPGGLTPDDAAKQAASTSYAVRTKQAELRAAAAKVDQAFVGYFPRVTVTASYTRVSETVNTLGGGGGASLGAFNGGPYTCTPAVPGGPCTVVDSGGVPVVGVSGGIELPQVLNQYSFMASLSVPISDYVLRLSQTYASASHAEKSKQIEIQAQALVAAADARVAFFNWVRPKAQLVVAQEAVAQAQAHVNDARQTLEVGTSKRADVLALEAQVASAEQLVAEVQALLDVAEVQLRTLMHAPEGKALEIGIDVLNEPATLPAESLESLQAEALKKRLEIRALDETQHSLKEAESVAKAGYLPRIDAFADLTVANPNPRVFAQEARWDATWDAGVRLTWTVNEMFAASSATAEARARTAAITEQKGTIRDALRLEVASAYADAKRSVAIINASERGIVSAQEALRVRLELFRVGEASGSDLIDAEKELTSARLRQIEGRIGLLVAKARLDHAVGRDVRAGAALPAPRAEE